MRGRGGEVRLHRGQAEGPFLTGDPLRGRRRTLAGLGLAAVSAFGYALLPVLAKLAYRRGAAPLQILSLRFLFAAPLFWATLLLLGRRGRRPSWRRGMLSLAAGGLPFGLASVCMFHAYRLLDASLAVIILYTYPPLVVAWDRFFHRRRLGGVTLLAMTSAFAGVVLTAGSPSLGGGRNDPLGVALALAAALLYSFYTQAAQRLVGGENTLPFAAWSATGTFLLAAALRPPLEALRHASGEIVLLAAGMAVFSTFLAIYTYARSIALIGASRAALVSNLEPAGVVVLSYFLLGERLTPPQLAGGALVLGGVYLLGRDRGA